MTQTEHNSNSKSNSKSKITRLPCLKEDNSSFLTIDNIKWFHYVSNWLPDSNKPLVFLPCGRANKTRGDDGRKFISQGMSHQFMSAITRNESLERVILSEPLTIIPYSLESHPLRPDYNLPPEELSIQSEIIFIHQLSFWLLKVKQIQSWRNFIFYVGSRHHFFILNFANKFAGEPFRIIQKIPKRGLIDYATAANELSGIIKNFMLGEVLVQDPIPSLEKHLKSRGRYTNKKFWKLILTMEKRKGESTLEVCPESQIKFGFEELYQFNF